MRIKRRYHSYPVLAPYTNDYKESKFSLKALDYDETPSKYIFNLELELKGEGIIDLIKNNKAEYVVHVECGKTSYREIFTSRKPNLEIELNISDIDGRIEFCPFVIAKDNLLDYYNTDFHPDFGDFSFNINKGQFLCIGNVGTATIIKDKDELKQLSSIIRITQVSDLDDKIRINLQSDRIHIQLSDELYKRYTYAARASHRIRTLHSMLIYPALIHVFSKLKEDAENNFESYSDRRWFQALEYQMERFNKELDGQLFQGTEPYELAQEILDYPIKAALDNIYESDQEEV